MGDVIIKQTENITKNTKIVETEVKNTIKNINVDLSKLDMSGAIDSFKRLEEVAKACNFDEFITKVTSLQDAFTGFQKAVQTANTSVTNFSKSADKLGGGNTAVVTNVEVNTGDIAADVGSVTEGVSSSFSQMSSSLSSSLSAISDSVQSVGKSAKDFGDGIASALDGVKGVINAASDLLNSFKSMGEGLILASVGVAALIPLLPLLGTSILTMAVNMAGIILYLPQLILLGLVLLGLSLIGEGLMSAGYGLINIGLGLTSMTEGMSALLTFMPIFIQSLSGIIDNIGGIIMFVLLAAAMLIMSIAVASMNEQLTTFVDNMVILGSIMSVGFVAAFAVFAVMLIAMSFFMDKVADGIQKITDAMTKQCAKLAILNPLMAAYAVLSNPIKGAITVALALTSGILVKALLPAMATGGVVSSPTVAMVGEGRYPEAVVPLGDSPQFASMKADIANAVITAMSMSSSGGNGGGRPIELAINLDGRVLAKQLYSPLQAEAGRRGY